MRTGFAMSLVAHAALITVGVLGLAQVQKLKPTEIQAISVDLVPIDKITSIRAGTEKSKVIDTPAPAVVDTPQPVKLAERPGSTQVDQAKPQETTKPTPAPTVQTAPEPVAQTQPVPKPAIKPEPAPAPQPDVKPVDQPTTKNPVLAAAPTNAVPADTAPKPALQTASLQKLRETFKLQQAAELKRKQLDKAAETAKAADKVAAIINTEKSRGATTGTGGQASLGKPTGQAAKLTQSELGALIAQMQRCWNPTLAERSGGVVIRLMVAMNTDGTVNGLPQILSDVSTPLAGLSARTAARKVESCGPFNLPPDKYDNWREIDVTLDASQAN